MHSHKLHKLKEKNTHITTPPTLQLLPYQGKEFSHLVKHFFRSIILYLFAVGSLACNLFANFIITGIITTGTVEGIFNKKIVNFKTCPNLKLASIYYAIFVIMFWIGFGLNFLLSLIPHN